MDPTPPDIMLIGAQWRDRALLRAQLIEAGYDVVAIDGWPMPALYLRRPMTPRALIVDLAGLPEPRAALDQIRLVIPPERVLIIAAIATMAVEDIRRLGYHVMTRPVIIGHIVDAARKLLG